MVQHACGSRVRDTRASRHCRLGSRSVPVKGGSGQDMDGVISFFGSYYASRAETVLRRGGFAVQLIAGPKELSPDCGVGLRFEYGLSDAVLVVLDYYRGGIGGE